MANDREARRQAYLEKLRDPRWQQLRLRVLERDGWKCLICGKSDSTLCVHHRRYLRGREPWEYELSDLATLCWDCHQGEHELKDEAIAILLESLTVIGGFFYDDFFTIAQFFAKIGRRPDLCWQLEVNVNDQKRREEFMQFLGRLFIPNPPTSPEQDANHGR
jgi:hypothetical protein